jgi:hypothetical protein
MLYGYNGIIYWWKLFKIMQLVCAIWLITAIHDNYFILLYYDNDMCIFELSWYK